MNKELNLTVPLPPSVNKYLGKKVGYKNGAPYVIVYETVEAKRYKANILRLTTKAKNRVNWKQTDENTYIVCELDIYLARKRQDSDNFFKVLLDSLTGAGIFYDDSMVIPRVKNVYIDTENPRINLTIKIADKIGVFGKSEYDSFLEKNCFKCKKSTQKCSLLKNSLENRIVNEIDLEAQVCKKLK